MTDTDTEIWGRMRHELWDQLSAGERLLDIKCILSGRKRKGWIALLPSQSPAGFAEITIRDYANGCHAQPVAFLEGIWVIKPYRRQGVGLALVKTIKQTFRSRELQSFVHQRTSKTPFRIRLIRAGSLMKQIALCFFEQRWFEKAVDAKKPAPLMQVQD